MSACLGFEADRQLAVERPKWTADQGRPSGAIQIQREVADTWQPVHPAAILQAPEVVESFKLCADDGQSLRNTCAEPRFVFTGAEFVMGEVSVDDFTAAPTFYVRAKEHVQGLFATDPSDSSTVEDESPVPSPESMAELRSPAPGAAPTNLPWMGTTDERAQLAAANQGGWRLLEQRRLDPERTALHGYQRLSALRVSRTDPDAALMRLKGGGPTVLGYHDHYVVDGGKQRIILAALVTPADVMENTPMRDLLWRVCFRWHLHPKRAVGDTTYGTAENIRALEDAGIRAYVPLPDWEQRTPYYGAQRFSYDAERDEYRCPQGQPLRRYGVDAEAEVVRYHAAATTCNACPVKADCTSSSHGRVVTRSFHAAYYERVRTYHATPAYQKAMRKRAVWVEPLFGEAKDWHGLRRFRLRGLAKVNSEALMIAAGQNLKHWLTTTWWKRRFPPGGSLAFPAVAS